MKVLRTKVIPSVLCGLLCIAQPVAWAADEAGSDSEASADGILLRTDFLNAAYLPGHERVFVSGLHGMVGLIDVGDDTAQIRFAENAPDEDFTAMARLSDSEVLLGSSTGRVYHFDGETFEELAAVSEYDEPVMSIAVDGSTVWVVGARGLVARSLDGGQSFENIEIRDIVTPPTPMPGGQPADWYFGVSNLDPDSIEFKATVDGEPAVADEHYTMYADEGFVQVQQQLDMDPPPMVSFTFSPGPPFRLGDVSWNVVLAKDNKVLIAGEFGMILQSEDNGETWVRRDVEIVPQEPEPAYWLAGARDGDLIWLTGAAGVTQRSLDGGATWLENPSPGREGIFGVTLEADVPVISGAVGLIGRLEGDDWVVADRTRLKLLSWLRSPVVMPDGTILILGGRASAIHYSDGEFERVPVSF
ncbi:MAG: hypothetical protein WD928_10400 [Gammaproteobacteria bacterium]